ncbi:hypothetical protein OROMI_003923 [Orobanche minor]
MKISTVEIWNGLTSKLRSESLCVKPAKDGCSTGVRRLCSQVLGFPPHPRARIRRLRPPRCRSDALLFRRRYDALLSRRSPSRRRRPDAIPSVDGDQKPSPPSPPVDGDQTPSPPVDGDQTPSPPSPPVDGDQTPSPPVDGDQTPSPPVDGDQTPSPPVDGDQTPSPPVDGDQTPSPPVDGDQTPSSPVDGDQTPSPPVDGDQTPSPPVDGVMSQLHNMLDSVLSNITKDEVIKDLLLGAGGIVFVYFIRKWVAPALEPWYEPHWMTLKKNKTFLGVVHAFRSEDLLTSKKARIISLEGRMKGLEERVEKLEGKCKKD